MSNHLASAEVGDDPKMVVNSYPSMEIIKQWSTKDIKPIQFVKFSPNGDLLAAQSIAPDYEIIVWQWELATVHIYFKSSFSDPINELNFSFTNNRALYTGGVEHLHFWNIVRTFTGLKLLHNVGSFGAYEHCDVLCIYPENNGRVLTNCDWGNILVWQNGEIRYEISGKNRRPCHQKTITQIHLNGDYLYTIAMDNFVRIWFWDPVAFSTLNEDERFIELEVTYEFQMPEWNGQSIDREHLAFVMDTEQHHRFYIHDGFGVIWKCSVDAEYTTHEMEMIFRSSSRNMINVCVSSCCQQIATLDEKGCFSVYQIDDGSMMFQHRFSTTATAMTWCPKRVNILIFKKNFTYLD